MEQQTISSAKASVVGKFNARATIIAACNPITPSQKYDQNLDI
jgi:DNA replicative helicase MCM subunit Mcm2 (Cdc46/Mcm family)